MQSMWKAWEQLGSSRTRSRSTNWLRHTAHSDTDILPATPPPSASKAAAVNLTTGSMRMSGRPRPCRSSVATALMTEGSRSSRARRRHGGWRDQNARSSWHLVTKA
uniref:Uncharacterized protein n=1 Tax=Arundo donax TaxID=35708 RepID=A0A0A9FFH0_ARUDO